MLTEKRIRDAKPGQKTRIEWDARVSGLGLRITPGGSKSFVLTYRVNGRQRRATLGRAGEVPLAAARQMAAEQKVLILQGDDPLERKQERKQAATMEQAVSRYFDEYLPERLAIGRITETTVKKYRKQWGTYLAPKLANRKVADLERRHIEAAVSKLPPVTRNRVLAFLSKLFNLFEVWDLRPQHTNPCRGIERAREEPRDRVLTADELERLATALKEYEGNFAAVAAIRVATLTGLRIGEVLSMEWEHIDFDTGRLLLPETKTGRRQHHLPGAALDVLRRLPRRSAWVFTYGGKVPCTYENVWFHFKQICAAAGIEGARLHDLRRTVMTLAAASGVGSHVLRDLLGHKTTAMADRYIRNVGNPVREARELVGAEIAKRMEGLQE